MLVVSLKSHTNFRVRVRRILLPVFTAALAVGVLSPVTSAATVSNGNIYYGNGKYVSQNGATQGTTSVAGLKSDKSSVSPNGAKVAYMSGSNVVVSNIDGSAARVVKAGESVPRSSDRTDTHLSWSPDGTKLAYVVKSSSDSTVAVVNADGTNYHRLAGLTNPNNYIYDADWANNNDVLYLPFNTAGNEKLCRVSQAGGNSSCTPLPRVRGVGAVLNNYQAFVVSPDHTKIAFLVTRDSYGPTQESVSVMVSNMNGSDMQYVYKSKISWVGGSTLPRTAAQDVLWSPDSKKLVFNVFGTDEDASQAGVYTVNADGSAKKKLPVSYGPLNAWLRS